MPTYTYQCKECNNSFDVFHSMSAKPRVKCPECGGGCKRLIGTGAGIIFKGSGFYATDYKNASSKAGSKASAPSSTESKPTETKSETKADSASRSAAAAKD